MLLDLPPHWLVPVFLGAAWSAGLAVTTTPQVSTRRRGVRPGHASPSTRPTADGQVVACSLLPFAVRFPEPLPAGVLDYGLLWPGQSDVFIGLDPPSPDTVAWLSAERPRTQADLLEAAAVARVAEGVRLLTDVHPANEHGVPAFLAPLAHGGSVVLLRQRRRRQLARSSGGRAGHGRASRLVRVSRRASSRRSRWPSGAWGQ